MVSARLLVPRKTGDSVTFKEVYGDWLPVAFPGTRHRLSSGSDTRVKHTRFGALATETARSVYTEVLPKTGWLKRRQALRLARQLL